LTPARPPLTAIGVDPVDVIRISRFLDRYDDVTLSHVFSRGELTAARSAALSGHYLSVCFGVKEAIGKAIGTGAVGIGWHDVEMTAQQVGEIRLRLSGAAAHHAAARGINRWHASAVQAGRFVIVVAIGC